ncbi:anticodon-binding domain-containing protein [Aspergillus alliaceus]|uniref:Anticodon-binding domain-containing protein n=1 Tax=Petromyces alliaceus TaxID=209559 RepID=A0A5N7CDX9_PETAA|nr:anticodon-binding domain-containing protein [Aspergillus alliaceus]KAB8234936.1 anticodon-binding domain-containing protein [Aspergillus alliaceus]KAE8392139.1 anticodon-binding domain-containing protein [Aspergillus alliaceus]
MAEKKRHGAGPRASSQGTSGPTGQGMAGAMVPLEVALSGAIGARVRITTAPVSSTIEGTLFTACPITNLVAVNTAADNKQTAGDYRIIPVSRIQSFQLLSLAPSSHNADGPSFTDAVPPVHALDIRALKAREANAVGKLHESEARRGKGVTREAQDLFDAFSRTMPTRWDGTSIIVADAVAIAAPYRVDDCRPLVAGDTAALARVRKVLEMERKKIELRNASASIGTANTFSRSASAKDVRHPSTNPNPSPGPGAAGPRKGG